MNRWQGEDASLEISLKEYGLAWIENDDDYLFIVGRAYSSDYCAEGEYTDFCTSTISKDEDFSHLPCSEEELSGDSLHQIITLKDYFGFNNIFGEVFFEGEAFSYEEALKFMEQYNEAD